jgi:hypothetical protein
MSYKRTNTNNQATDSGQITSLAWNTPASGNKVMAVGPLLKPSGTLASPQQFAPGQLVYVFNNSASVGFVGIYNAGSTPPVLALGTAIPIPPYSYQPLSMGAFNTISGSAATLGLLLVIDDTRLVPNPSTI